MIYALLFTLAAHAGFFGDLCGRYLVADDPYQYESAGTEWLGRRFEALEIKRRWRALDAAEARELALVRAEIKRREIYSSIEAAYRN